MEGLGDLGFWLAVGIVIAVWILSDARKERERARDRQETRRALLSMEGKDTTEILAYLRENDAAEQKREDDQRAASRRTGRKVLAILAALAAGLIVFLLGVRLSNGLDIKGPIAFFPVAAGGLVTALVYILIRGKKNVPPPGA